MKNSLIAAAACSILLVLLIVLVWRLWPASSLSSYRYVSTVAGTGKEIGEPFGIAVRDGVIYVSDGQNDNIGRIDGGKATVFAEGLDTPSGIVFDKEGSLIVADTGSNTLKSVNAEGEVSIIAKGCGVSRHQALETGSADETPLNGPIGVAAGSDGRIYFADTYNDRICVIDKGMVTTLAGGTRGFADGDLNARFDTPTGLAIWGDKLLIADTGNRRIRVVETDGSVWTLAGSGDGELNDGLLAEASFVQPTAIAVDREGMIFIADGNAIRRIGGTVMPSVTTVSSPWRGLKDGAAPRARFNRPSGLTFDKAGNLIVADSENRLVRRFSQADKGTPVTNEQIAALRDKPEEFRNAAPARWPYDPPDAKRDVAGTLGEIRGLVTPGDDQIWFHNGLDIAGAYGETARFIRDEKVLRPIAAENFGTLRELIRMPTLGYIHIRLGRSSDGKPFDDKRFQFQKDADGKMSDVRVPRGTKFKAGEPIGTLNPMNHVHLIAGRSGSEMNALDALILPGISDVRPPVIEDVKIYDQNWNPVETVSPNSRIKLTEKARIVVRAYDQMDGNSERRRLGVYKLGYQFVRDGQPVGEAKWTIVFDRMPSNEAVRFAFGPGSHSGATGETIFNYIVSNFVNGDEFREAFLDTTGVTAGNYVLKAFAADYFSNTTSKDIEIEVLK